MQYRDIKFTTVSFPDEDVPGVEARFFPLVLDVLAIDAYAEFSDPAVAADRPLLELELRNGSTVYLVDTTLEELGQLRRHAKAQESPFYALSPN